MDGSTKRPQDVLDAVRRDAVVPESPRRKANRVVQLFPSDLFDGHMMRRALFLPEHLRTEDLTLGSTPVTKMINIMPLQSLVERRRREQAINREMTGTVAARLLEPVTALQKRLRPGAALDLGMTFVDYVQEGQHSKDTTFFFLYHIAEEKPRRSSVQAFESAAWGKPFTGTEEGLWFVLAVVDVLVNTDLGPITLLSTQLSSTAAAKYPIAVFADDTARLTQEYKRFLLGRNAPPRTPTSTPCVDLLHLGSDVSFLLFQQRAIASTSSTSVTGSSSPMPVSQTPPPPQPPSSAAYHWPRLERRPETTSPAPSLSPALTPTGPAQTPQTDSAGAEARGTTEGVRLPSLRDLIESARPMPPAKRHEGATGDLTALCRAVLAQAPLEDEEDASEHQPG